MFLRLFIFFTTIPLIEIYVLLKIGSKIGLGSTIFLVLLTGFVGAHLARSQGLKVIRDINTVASQGGIPGRELLHGLMIFVGGITLLTPGFVTDIMGISFLFPVTREFYIQIFSKWMAHKVAAGTWNYTVDFGGQTFSSSSGQHSSQNGDPSVIEVNDYSKKE